SRIASTIWLPTVCTGLNEDIGSWKMSAISPPRIARISSPFGLSFVRSITVAAPPLRDARRNRISPSTIRPGRSTMRKIERAVTLLPQPLSPTMPSVPPGATSKLTPSTAFTRPSSCAKYVLSSRTESRLSAIGIRGVAQAVTQEVEGHDHDDHGHGGGHPPGRARPRPVLVRPLEQGPPAQGTGRRPPREKSRPRDGSV